MTRLLAARMLIYAAACGLSLPLVARFQHPSLSALVLWVLVALAVVPPLAALRLGRRAAIAAQAVCALAALAVCAGSARPAELVELIAHVPRGVHEWFAVTLPYSPELQRSLRGTLLVLLTVLLSSLAWVWLVRQRPLAAAVLALVPFAVATTVYVLDYPILRGLAALVVVLAFLGCELVLTGLAEARRALAATAFAALTGSLLAVVLSSGAAGALDWTSWRLGTDPATRVGVRYVWDQSYRGLHWPRVVTDVFSVRAPRPEYWRATILEQFDGLRFREGSPGAASTPGGAVLVTATPAVGPVTPVSVQLSSLDEPYLLAPGQPIAYDVPASAGGATLLADSAVRTIVAPRAGTRYAVSTLLADPAPAALRTLGADYPSAIVAPDLTFAGAALPPWGSAGREAAMAQLFREHAGEAAWIGWQRAYRFARRETADAATPYQAVALLEARLHARSYDESAALPDRPGALAAFAVSGTRGYCQMYSASLAAMTRLLGIPARVAEGFTTGHATSSGYVVTDRDAHAWVEVWFPTKGWISFEPTPTRQLPGTASTSSVSFRAPDLGLGRGGGQLHLPVFHPTIATPPVQAPGGRAVSLTTLVLLLAPLLGLALWLLAKRAVLARRGPRARIVGFAADQGVALRPALTHGELAAQLADRFEVDAAPWASAADTVRFACEPGREAVAALELQTAGVLAELRGTCTRRARVRGAVSARSLRATDGGYRSAARLRSERAITRR